MINSLALRSLALPARRLTIDLLLSRFRPAPDSTALLGVCDDDMLLTYPMPARKPILVLGSQGAGKTNLLKTLAFSARAKVSDATLLVVTDDPREWDYGEVFDFSRFSAVSSFLQRWTPGERGARKLLVLLDNIDNRWPDATDLLRISAQKPFSLVATTLPNRWGNLQRQVFAADAGFILGQGASDDLLPGHFITRSRSKWVQFQPATF